VTILDQPLDAVLPLPCDLLQGDTLICFECDARVCRPRQREENEVT